MCTYTEHLPYTHNYTAYLGRVTYESKGTYLCKYSHCVCWTATVLEGLTENKYHSSPAVLGRQWPEVTKQPLVGDWPETSEHLLLLIIALLETQRKVACAWVKIVTIKRLRLEILALSLQWQHRGLSSQSMFVTYPTTQTIHTGLQYTQKNILQMYGWNVLEGIVTW